MHFRQKLIFMALGSALTLAGYLLATVISEVTAQDNNTESLGDVVCDSITVRAGGSIKIVDEDSRVRVLVDSTGIKVFDGISDFPRVLMHYLASADKGVGVVGINGGDGGGIIILENEIVIQKDYKTRFLMRYNPDTDLGGIWIRDKNNAVRTFLTEEMWGILDESSYPRISIGFDPESETSLMKFSDPSARSTRLQMGLDSKSNAACFQILDKSGNYNRVKIWVDGETDDGVIGTYDRNGDVSGYLHKH